MRRALVLRAPWRCRRQTNTQDRDDDANDGEDGNGDGVTELSLPLHPGRSPEDGAQQDAAGPPKHQRRLTDVIFWRTGDSLALAEKT